MASKKVEYLFVDGYNIVFAWNELNSLAVESLENARNRLLDILSDYAGASGINITVVFDAHRVKSGTGVRQIYNGNVNVVFTKEFETADNYIEKAAGTFGKRTKVRVATGDNLEQIIVMGKGAQRISANDLLNEINLSKTRYTKRHIEKQPVKTNMLYDNIDPKIREQLEKMRRKGG